MNWDTYYISQVFDSVLYKHIQISVANHMSLLRKYALNLRRDRRELVKVRRGKPQVYKSE